MSIFHPGDRVLVHVPHGFEGFATVTHVFWDADEPVAYTVITAHRRMTIEAEHVSPAR